MGSLDASFEKMCEVILRYQLTVVTLDGNGTGGGVQPPLGTDLRKGRTLFTNTIVWPLYIGVIMFPPLTIYNVYKLP
jgi:hypothetical protein